MNASLFRRKRRRNGKLLISAFWSIKYQENGTSRYRVRKLRVRDKQVAQQLLNEFIREKESESYGIIPPPLLREAAQKPLTDHLTDFLADLRARGRAAKYVYNIERRLNILLVACGWHAANDVTADSFVSWRGTQKKAAKTLNEYLDAAVALLNWMRRHGRLLTNPLAVVGKVDVRGKQVRKPRALTDDEVTSLLAAAPERKPLYLTALLTGLRRNELKKLEWSDIHLDGPRPFLTVRASTAKNRKAASLWLRDDLVAELRRIRPSDAGSSLSVFGRIPKMARFRADLKAAGISDKKDAQGREVFFHSLRHTLATNLARGGVAPRVAMELMRHSEMRLTMSTYTDVALLPMADALERLPRFEVAAAGQQTAASGCQNPAGSGTQKGTQNVVRDGHSESVGVNNVPSPSAKENGGNAEESQQKSAVVHLSPLRSKSSAGRTRS